MARWSSTASWSTRRRYGTTWSIATEVATAQAIGFVLLGAYNALTRIVSPDALAAAMEELLPPYRKQHAPANVRALEAGAAAFAPAGQ